MNEQTMRVSPSLVALNQILALSSQELQMEVRRELESNPALELSDAPICPSCGDVLKGRVCQRCLVDNPNALGNHAQDYKNNSDEYSYGEDYSTPDESYSNGSRDEEFDPITIVAAEMPLSERLLSELAAVLPREDMPIAEFLVGSLDERGYLSTTAEAVASTFSTEVARVERVLKELQLLAPPGVGARDLRECLLLQLDHLKENAQEIAIPAHVDELVDQYLTALGEHKYGHIAQQLHVPVDEVHAMREFIKHHLNPFPSEGQTSEPNGLQTRSGRAGYVVPDVIISEHSGEFRVEVIESKRFFLRVSPMYAKLSGDSVSEAISSSDRDHVKQYVARAKFFMSNINQRRETMLKITKCLVDVQADFLRDGVRGLKPLTRSMLASYIGMHESTVSRATASKYVMLPTRKVIPFSDFFTASLSIKDVIKEIIEKESGNRSKPLTDQDIVEKLEDQGIRIARRTVAKYRTQLKILPSTLR